MKALYPLGMLLTFAGGWFLSNHWTRGTSLWLAVPFLVLGAAGIAVSIYGEHRR